MHALALALCLTAAAPAAPPNVLLILSDDQAAAHVGCYGNPDLKTPRLDALAAQGLRFTRCYTTAPQCVPSRASLMTGRSPVAIDMTRFSAPLPREVVAFPELLRDAGYFTGICGRTYHLDGSGGMPPESARVFDERNLRTFKDRVDWLPKSSGDAGVAADVAAFLKQAEGKPFFLQAGFSDPHRSFTAGPGSTPAANLHLPPFFPDTPGVRSDYANYLGEIERLDGNVGAVLDVLAQSGQAGNTLVIFLGDNGCALFRGKGTLYEFGLNVPCLIRWPGVVEAGGVSEALVSGEDLAPTILAAAGLTPPESMTGINFLPSRSTDSRREPPQQRAFVFAERGAHGSGLPNNTGAFDLGRTVIGPRYKLIYNALPSQPYHPVDFAGNDFWKEILAAQSAGDLQPLFTRLYFPPARPMFELYDLETDPHELVNLAGHASNVAEERELKAALQEWMIVERDFLPLPVPPPAKPGAKRQPRVEPTPEPITTPTRK